ncbi:hypothetical protein GCM10027515_02330 [Schumannella luteola]|uniref:Uncharacterized protein n=1 Tax=Schumannella luteola TaxID=472059 RepID=A0A852YHS0_9MICO|nr:hypothetical protein [Schumannella luteola]NYG98628.1 hypothetical protein [Schumannella luteola]TPX02599.1 hypothetical protein FJ656_21675 [Schumannella luteola]
MSDSPVPPSSEPTATHTATRIAPHLSAIVVALGAPALAALIARPFATAAGTILNGGLDTSVSAVILTSLAVSLGALVIALGDSEQPEPPLIPVARWGFAVGLALTLAWAAVLAWLSLSGASLGDADRPGLDLLSTRTQEVSEFVRWGLPWIVTASVAVVTGLGLVRTAGKPQRRHLVRGLRYAIAAVPILAAVITAQLIIRAVG